jgi:hypothetical protein
MRGKAMTIYIAGPDGKPLEAAEAADDEAFWREMERMPDLHALVDRAGRRYAASIGEEYIEDPFRRMKEKPHQGGHRHITPEEWARWDRANEVFQARRREGLKP